MKNEVFITDNDFNTIKITDFNFLKKNYKFKFKL